MNGPYIVTAERRTGPKQVGLAAVVLMASLLRPLRTVSARCLDERTGEISTNGTYKMKKALFKALMTAAFSILLSFTVMGQSDDNKQKKPPPKDKNRPTIPVRPKNDRPKDDKKDKPKKPPGDFAYVMYVAKEE